MQRERKGQTKRVAQTRLVNMISRFISLFIRKVSMHKIISQSLAPKPGHHACTIIGHVATCIIHLTSVSLSALNRTHVTFT